MNIKEAERVIYTVGHSNRSFDEFLSLLNSFYIKLIADIRSLPGSRKYPHFDKEQLQVSLPQHNIKYIHIEKLGGRRRASKNNTTAWKHPAFKGYAEYMETESFLQGIKELEESAITQRVAYMCSEAVWWSCHRAMVSDYLKIHGWQVQHIMAQQKSTEHPYTSPARIVGGNLTYELDPSTNK